MAKNDNTKSQAELYREERKARIAKAATKNAKNIASRKKAAKATKIAIAVIIALAIVAGAVYAFLPTLSGSFTAVEVGGTKVSVGQFNYYYVTAYNNLLSTIEQYSSYGYDYGYDTTLAPDVQETEDSDGKTIKWSELLKQSALDNIQQVISYYNEAVKAGVTISEDQQAEIDATVESAREEANTYGYSLNRYLKLSFGNGFNEKQFVKMLEIQTLAQNMIEDKTSEIEGTLTDEVMTAEYKENSKDYDRVDLRYYTITYKTLTAEEGEKDDALAKRQKEANSKLEADAKEILEKVKDEESLIDAVKEYNDAETDATTDAAFSTYSELEAALTEKGADWAYAKDRKAGDKTVVSSDKASYIIYCVKPAYAPTSVTVRHCLVSFGEELTAETATAEQKEAASKKASKLLADLGDDFKEDDFKKMVTENTDDTASAESGGLYDDVRLDGNYVAEFTEWSCDPDRKAGDTGIVETDYGYHIMYFVEANKDDLDWKADMKETKTNEALTEYEEKILAEDSGNTVDVKEFWVDLAVKDYCDTLRTNLAYSQMNG